jgi:hypothetical protein
MGRARGDGVADITKALGWGTQVARATPSLPKGTQDNTGVAHADVHTGAGLDAAEEET